MFLVSDSHMLIFISPKWCPESRYASDLECVQVEQVKEKVLGKDMISYHIYDRTGRHPTYIAMKSLAALVLLFLCGPFKD